MNCKYCDNNVIETHKLVTELYNTSEGCVGGALHIVLYDGNLDTDDIEWCIKNCDSENWINSPVRELCLQIANNMLKMTIEQRKLIYYGDWYKSLECNNLCDGIKECENCIIVKDEELE